MRPGRGNVRRIKAQFRGRTVTFWAAVAHGVLRSFETHAEAIAYADRMARQA